MKRSGNSLPAGEVNLYLGSYTQLHSFVPEASGAGITACAFDARSGRLALRSEAGDILNPSYLALDGKNGHLFAVSENFDAEGAIHVFQRRSDGSLLAAGAQPSGGRATCHICVTPGGQVCASSYLDGCESIYSFLDGKLGPRELLFHYQEKDSHAHQAVVSPDARWLYVCDPGVDRIWRHPLVSGKVAPTPPDAISTPAGYGPRHLVFHPALPRVYVICELNAHLLAYDWDAGSGGLSPAGDWPSLPENWKGEPAAAAIRFHPSAPALYVSNRNHDSLTAFRLDAAGRATFACRLPSGGKTPRDFAIDPSGRWLLCANQNSNHIAIHELDRVTGLPAGGAPGLVSVATPVCVLFAP